MQVKTSSSDNYVCDAARSQVAELEVQSIAQCDTPIEKDLTGQGQPARFFLAPLRGAKSTTER